MNKSSVGFRGVSVCTLGLSAALLSGCMTTHENVRPVAQVAVAKSSNTYVIKRASIRTPASEGYRSSVRREVERQVVQQSQPRRQPQEVARYSSPASGLSREQYHARYQAELRAREAEQERLRQAREAAAERQRIAREESIRQEYLEKWERNKAAIEAKQAKAQAKLERQQAEAKVKRVQQQAEVKVKRERAQVMVKKVENVIQTAASHIGTKYVWGGSSPSTGFDCSGLVQHSLAQGANVRVPRTAAEQYAAAVKVSNGQATRGDLVFFRTRGNSVSHVGIYLGNGKFLHAPRKGKTVTTSTISGYWEERLIGFGRIPGACRLPMV